MADRNNLFLTLLIVKGICLVESYSDTAKLNKSCGFFATRDVSDIIKSDGKYIRLINNSRNFWLKILNYLRQGTKKGQGNF